MRCVKIDGGLGNQLFIYSFAYALYKKTNDIIYLDKVVYQGPYQRSYTLDKYPLEIKSTFSKVNIKSFLLSKPYKLYHKIKLKKLFESRIIDDNNYSQQNIGSNDLNYYYSGYWQNASYFDEYRDSIVKQFKVKNPSKKLNETKKIITDQNFCAVHIRRGDYAVYDNNSILPLYYYEEAIKKMTDNDSSLNFLVFSDEIEYCKNIFKDYKNFYYINDLGKFEDYEELEIMSCCKSFIIANSSFSWWGAYLSNSNNVICPYYRKWKDNFYFNKWDFIEVKG